MKPLFLFTIRDGGSYDYTICHDDRLVISVMYLCQVILDTIEFIGSCEKQMLLEELKQAATGVSISKTSLFCINCVRYNLILLLQKTDNKDNFKICYSFHSVYIRLNLM